MLKKFSGKIISLPLLIIVFLMIQIASAWSVNISGTVKIDGKKDKSGVLITVQGQSLSAVTDKDGNYSIQNVPSGSYTITAQKPGNISVKKPDVVVGTINVTNIDFQLIPGDLKIDNQINLLDRIMLSRVWKTKKGDVDWEKIKYMDIVEDDVIDEKDRELLLSNWRKGNYVQFGSISIVSNPSKASILINGADTGFVTPHTFDGLIVDKYTITLQMKNYAPIELIADLKENPIQVIPTVILDNQPPDFTDWATDPIDLTEDVKGRFQIAVTVTDKGGSGMGDKEPQFDYHIGDKSDYTEYKPIEKSFGRPLGSNRWSFDIPEPDESWDAYRGKYIYYKVKAEDAAGNSGESIEQQKLIISINDPPTVRIVNAFSLWQKGLLTITADANDTDGTITGVQFEYSFDNAIWTQIGLMVTTSPYSVPWDTKTIIKDVMKNVWVRATAYDNENASAKYVTPTGFGVDNQAPTTSHDYDGLWHNKDFSITLKATDASGIGVSTISYKLNNGSTIDSQANASVLITKEDSSNIIEYWSTDQLGNEEQHKNLPGIKLDKTLPLFTDWKQDPTDLTEDTKGRFRISVRVTDDGSGLTGKVPQIDYHVGTETQFDGFENMITEDGKTWYFDILEPSNTWDFYRGKYLYYKAQCSDVAGNLGVSPDRIELIDNINDPPIVKIISTFTTWQKDVLKIDATASDQDGTVTGVQFEYSLDKAIWKPIGTEDISAPYSTVWDTVAFIPQAPSVWVRATATDNEKLSATYLSTSIGIDNQAPTTSDDYNDLWHKDDFVITLTANDGNGIGVPAKNIRYKLDNGEEKNIQANGQPKITVEGIHQLEYWSIDDLNNTEIHRTVKDIKLDKTPPTFADWTKDPANLTEDSVGSLRISVRVSDGAGSGLTGKIPQLAYHIGKETVYGEYVNMVKGEAKDVWYYDILEPVGKWDSLRGKSIYFKAQIQDIAGNATETSDQQESIDDINDPPTVKIITTFNAWEKGSLKIDSDVSDTDGKISNVLFEYSLNKVDWKPIGTAVAFPYSILWDTKASIPQVALIVWVKATATDDGGLSKEFVIPNSLRVDNEPPVTSHNYDGSWQNKNFVITLTVNDKNGIGVANISYKLNDAAKQTVPTNGQVGVPVSITTEISNNLEYWGVDGLGNEETHKLLTNINLDRTPPKFSNWEQVPTDLTENTVGKLRILVTIIDSESGLTEKIAQIDYHVGTDSKYEDKNMQTEGGKIWYFDIPEPTEKWDSYRGGYVYYKVKVEDVAKNSVESLERRELIDSINDPPVVNLISTFKDWETREIEIKAVASDPDGSIPSVQFAYSLDNNIWKNIGSPDNTSPYSVIWDTRTDIPNLAKSVWVRVTAIDTDDKTVTVNSEPSRKFGIDNQAPVSGNWTKAPANLTEDTPGVFRVSVEFIDGEGSGVDRAELAYKIGTSNYKNYRDMKRESSNVWYYEIIESGGWDQYRVQTLYYKARATDLIGNVSPETNEQLELIDDINDPPTGLITNSFKDWEKGSIIIQANASDQDGTVKTVQFQSSVDNTKWVDIGSPLTKTPYSVTYDSTVIDVDPDVWIKALVTDDDGAVTELLISKSFGVDNKPPDLANWKLIPENLTESSKESSFRVEVEVTDQGSGVDETRIQLNYKIANGKYSEYQTMYKESGSRWFLEIPKPIGNWSSYANQKVFYRVKALDKAGNIIESEERSELIDPTTGVVSGSINPRESWRVAKVAIQLNAQTIAEVAVNQVDGTYSVSGLPPALYNLQVSAIGFGTDKSKTNIEVKVGQVTSVPIVELFTYSVETIGRSQGGKVDFRDADIKDYSMAIEANTFTKDTKVVLGFGGSEPTSIPNPTVRVLGRSIGVGFEGKNLLKPLKLTLPRPSGITDTSSIMLFIYNGIDYRWITRNTILANDATITAYVIPPDVQNFSDPNHRFDRVLSKTADTVFYVIITAFDEPAVSTSDLGIRNPVLSTDSSKISVYAQPTITSLNRKIALVMHGVTSKADDMVYIIKDLRSLTPTNSTSPYYDQVLIFNYDSGTQLISNNSSFLVNELAKVLTNFSGKIDVIAHDSGALVARHAITARGMDQFFGSLIMLAAPHGGINPDLLKVGFNSFLKKTQSDPIWTYYRDGWQEIFENTTSLGALNNQPGRKVNTHYYGISASDPGATNDLENQDGLVYIKNVDYTNNVTFPFIEQGLTELYEKVNIIPPTFEGKGFMSLTRHLAILSSDVRNKIMTYLRGKSENINVVQNDIDLTPGNRIEDFKVILKNIGTETVFGVSAQLSTTNQYIRKFNGQQGIEKDNTVYGDIIANQIVTGSFKFDVSPTATSANGQAVEFTLVIRNSKDNSITIEKFNARIGGNVIRIALNAQQEQLAIPNTNKDTDRPLNDGDIAREPGEIMGINITLENRSASSIPSVKATLKTDDTRVKGLIGTTEVNMATDGITIDYGSMAGTGKIPKDFKYIKLLNDPTLIGSQINFTLDIKSGADTIGRDTFSVKTGASIVVDSFKPDSKLIPGGIAKDIDVDIRNTTSTNLSDIDVVITPSATEFNLVDDTVNLDLLKAIDTDQLTYSATIDAGFAGYVTFTVEIKVKNAVVNKETFRQYFGMRTQYVLDWITSDSNSNNIAEPGESIRLQIARMNPTNETAKSVHAVLSTANTAITVTRNDPSYNDILSGETKSAEYRFTVAQDIAGSISTLNETTLTVSPSPNWTGGAFVGRFLNPNTTSGDPQYLFRITGNGPNSITVATTATSTLLDPDNIPSTGNPQIGDPFQVIRPLGQPVQFTLAVKEDGQELGNETYDTRIGGIVRYLPPAGFDAFKLTIDDSKTMSSTNNPNGIPEPGEKIGITITLINIGSTSLTNVTAVLSSDEDDVNIDTDEGNYSSMSSSGTSKKKTAKFTFTIDKNTTMNKLLFRLDIEGDINTTSTNVSTNVNLGTDYFYIPVKRQL